MEIDYNDIAAASAARYAAQVAYAYADAARPSRTRNAALARIALDAAKALYLDAAKAMYLSAYDGTLAARADIVGALATARAAVVSTRAAYLTAVRAL